MTIKQLIQSNNNAAEITTNLAKELQLSKSQSVVVKKLVENYIFNEASLEQTVRAIEEYIK